MTNTILLNVQAGLGNQMFQYAAALNLARKNKSKLMLETSWYNQPYASQANRLYKLPFFDLYEDELRLDEFRSNSYFIVQEASMGFNPKLQDIEGNIALRGYFQNFNYFREIQREIREKFSAPSFIKGKPDLIEKHKKPNNSCALHVRLGDFEVMPKFRTLTGERGLNYYQTAIDLVKKEVKDPIFYVYSDSIDGAKKFLEPLVKGNEFIFSQNGYNDNVEEIYDMAQCYHTICANSTFSWWAGFLNPNMYKVVTFPKNVFDAKYQSIEESSLDLSAPHITLIEN